MFAECWEGNTRQTGMLPSVFDHDTQQSLCRVPRSKTLGKFLIQFTHLARTTSTHTTHTHTHTHTRPASQPPPPLPGSPPTWHHPSRCASPPLHEGAENNCTNHASDMRTIHGGKFVTQILIFSKVKYIYLHLLICHILDDV